MTNHAAVIKEKQPVQAAQLPDYSKSGSTVFDHVIAFFMGFAAIFLVLFIFYKLVLLSLAGGVLGGIVNIFWADQRAVMKRRVRLRGQFYDLLESLSVAMRAGNPDIQALESAREDLLLMYPETSDIIQEVSILIALFRNSVPLSEAYSSFAQRSGLEDIASFASIYKTIEGKSSRSSEIVKQTQEIISDKMEIEMEIETLLTSAKSEINIMLVMPLMILGMIGYMGSGFMDVIYTTVTGRIVASFGVLMVLVSYALAQKFSDIEL